MPSDSIQPGPESDDKVDNPELDKPSQAEGSDEDADSALESAGQPGPPTPTEGDD
jgi:hypothetical protein